MSKQNRRYIIPADTVGGATGRESIASMWKNHYANLFNCVDTVSDNESVLDTISRVANVHDALCSDDVKSSIKSLSANKVCGLDNLFAVHIFYMLVLVFILCLVFVSMLLLYTDFCPVI